MTEIVRVVRILEYTGPRASVEKVLQQNTVKGFKDFGAVVIRETMLPFPEVVEAPMLVQNPVMRRQIGHKSGCVTINCGGCGTDFYSQDYSGV